MVDCGQAEASSPWSPDLLHTLETYEPPLLPEAALDGGMLLDGPDTLPYFFEATLDGNFSPATMHPIQALIIKHPLAFLGTYTMAALILFGLFNFWPRAEGKASNHKPPPQDKKSQGRKTTKGTDQNWRTLHALHKFCSLQCNLCGQASETPLGTEEEGKNGYDFQAPSAAPALGQCKGWPTTKPKFANDKTEEDDKQDASAGYEKQVIIWDDLPSVPGQWPLSHTVLPTHQEIRSAQTTPVLSTGQATLAYKIIPPAAETFDSRTALTLKKIANPAVAEKITFPEHTSSRYRAKLMAEFGMTKAARPTQEIISDQIISSEPNKETVTQQNDLSLGLVNTSNEPVASARTLREAAMRKEALIERCTGLSAFMHHEPPGEICTIDREALAMMEAVRRDRQKEAARVKQEEEQAAVERQIQESKKQQQEEQEKATAREQLKEKKRRDIQAYNRDVADAEFRLRKRDAAAAARWQFELSSWRQRLEEQRRSAILFKQREAAREKAERVAWMVNLKADQKRQAQKALQLEPGTPTPAPRSRTSRIQKPLSEVLMVNVPVVEEPVVKTPATTDPTEEKTKRFRKQPPQATQAANAAPVQQEKGATPKTKASKAEKTGAKDAVPKTKRRSPRTKRAAKATATVAALEKQSKKASPKEILSEVDLPEGVALPEMIQSGASQKGAAQQEAVHPLPHPQSTPHRRAEIESYKPHGLSGWREVEVIPDDESSSIEEAHTKIEPKFSADENTLVVPPITIIVTWPQSSDIKNRTFDELADVCLVWGIELQFADFLLAEKFKHLSIRSAQQPDQINSLDPEQVNAPEAENVNALNPKTVHTPDSEIVNEAQPEPANGPEPGNVNESVLPLNPVAQTFARTAATVGSFTANGDDDFSDLSSDPGSIDEDVIAMMNASAHASRDLISPGDTKRDEKQQPNVSLPAEDKNDSGLREAWLGEAPECIPEEGKLGIGDSKTPSPLVGQSVVPSSAVPAFIHPNESNNNETQPVQAVDQPNDETESHSSGPTEDKIDANQRDDAVASTEQSDMDEDLPASVQHHPQSASTDRGIIKAREPKNADMPPTAGFDMQSMQVDEACLDGADNMVYDPTKGSGQFQVGVEAVAEFTPSAAASQSPICTLPNLDAPPSPTQSDPQLFHLVPFRTPSFGKPLFPAFGGFQNINCNFGFPPAPVPMQNGLFPPVRQHQNLVQVATTPQQDLDMYEGEPTGRHSPISNPRSILPTPFNRDDTGDVDMAQGPADHVEIANPLVQNPYPATDSQSMNPEFTTISAELSKSRAFQNTLKHNHGILQSSPNNDEEMKDAEEASTEPDRDVPMENSALLSQITLPTAEIDSQPAEPTQVEEYKPNTPTTSFRPTIGNDENGLINRGPAVKKGGARRGKVYKKGAHAKGRSTPKSSPNAQNEESSGISQSQNGLQSTAPTMIEEPPTSVAPESNLTAKNDVSMNNTSGSASASSATPVPMAVLASTPIPQAVESDGVIIGKVNPRFENPSPFFVPVRHKIPSQIPEIGMVEGDSDSEEEEEEEEKKKGKTFPSRDEFIELVGLDGVEALVIYKTFENRIGGQLPRYRSLLNELTVLEFSMDKTTPLRRLRTPTLPTRALILRELPCSYEILMELFAAHLPDPQYRAKFFELLISIASIDRDTRQYYPKTKKQNQQSSASEQFSVTNCPATPNNADQSGPGQKQQGSPDQKISFPVFGVESRPSPSVGQDPASTCSDNVFATNINFGKKVDLTGADGDIEHLDVEWDANGKFKGIKPAPETTADSKSAHCKEASMALPRDEQEPPSEALARGTITATLASSPAEEGSTTDMAAPLLTNLAKPPVAAVWSGIMPTPEAIANAMPMPPLGITAEGLVRIFRIPKQSRQVFKGLVQQVAIRDDIKAQWFRILPFPTEDAIRAAIPAKGILEENLVLKLCIGPSEVPRLKAVLRNIAFQDPVVWEWHLKPPTEPQPEIDVLPGAGENRHDFIVGRVAIPGLEDALAST